MSKAKTILTQIMFATLGIVQALTMDFTFLHGSTTSIQLYFIDINNA